MLEQLTEVHSCKLLQNLDWAEEKEYMMRSERSEYC
jgi:hypothetical protein